MIKNVKKYIEGLIAKDELWKFYKTKDWMTLKEQILKENHHECEICKQNGKITRYDVAADGSRQLISTVHHVMHVRQHPELALSRTFRAGEKEYANLIPVCKSCHNILHPEKRRRRKGYAARFVNQERW